MTQTTVIAGEHFPYLNGVKMLILSILGKQAIIKLAHNIKDIEALLQKEEVNILITDTMLNNIDCSTIIQRTLELQPTLKILIISKNPSFLFSQRYLNSGAFGYICSSDTEQEFISAFKQIYLGKKYSPFQQFNSNQGNKPTPLTPFDHLTNQEFAVLHLLLEGKGMKEVAAALSLKISTASTYKTRLFRKLNIDSLMELFNLASYYKINTIKA